MRKYWVIFKVNWQNCFEYRGKFFANLINGVITLVVMVFIFRAIFNQTNDFAGYTFSSIFTYLLMTRILHFLTRGNTARLIGDEIKEGRLSTYLLKPVSYRKYWFFSFLADRMFELIIRFLLLFLFLILFPAYLKLPSLGIFSLFLIFLFISLIFNFFFNFLLAMLAFWVTDIRLFSTLVGLIIGFLAGELIPLDILPGVLKKISLVLPFQYVLYFPIKLYQGSLSPVQIATGMLISLFWILVFLWILNYFWRKGVKRYEAVGQ